ncbi:MAG TPA: CpsB/CapC family capsule biosynthesis tyrosine phosphatase [Solirubrobacter sp.]|nr:CpsB/CapC family capsule biosynthesis tyrosine phosphatase [Solirubrobacter sp.]
MIDLHSHVLPGLDDGSPDLEAALALAREVAASGVRVLAATPHLRADFPDVRVSELPARVRALQAAVDAAGLDLRIALGGEVDLLWAQGVEDDTLRAVTYDARGTDLLVETPYGELPPLFEDLLFRIRVRGFRVLLAHPERNPSFQRDPARLLRLVENDLLVQLTAASVVGGGRAAKLAARLIADGHAHVIAGDLHRPNGSRAGLRAAVEHAGARAEWMVTDAPAAILEGAPLPPAPTGAAPRRRRWSRRS